MDFLKCPECPNFRQLVTYDDDEILVAVRGCLHQAVTESCIVMLGIATTSDVMTALAFAMSISFRGCAVQSVMSIIKLYMSNILQISSGAPWMTLVNIACLLCDLGDQEAGLVRKILGHHVLVGLVVQLRPILEHLSRQVE